MSTQYPVQPDLFGEYDADQERQRVWSLPATCPSCGTTEPNGHRLRDNHGYDPVTGLISGFPLGQHPNYGSMCLAQHLVRNHITYYVADGNAVALEERCRRGQELQLDVDQIIRDAQARLTET